MTINKTANDGQLCLALQGRLDMLTASDLEAVLRNSLDGVSELVLDLAELEYISSAGLRVLLYAFKTMKEQGSMKIKNVNETVMEVFEITGFANILTFE